MSKKLIYYQQILQKVSFDVRLFRKELKKAYKYLTPRDCDILRQWVDEFTMNRSDLQLALHSS
jgi:type IV secretory pathway TrbF-like protein